MKHMDPFEIHIHVKNGCPTNNVPPSNVPDSHPIWMENKEVVMQVLIHFYGNYGNNQANSPGGNGLGGPFS